MIGTHRSTLRWERERTSPSVDARFGVYCEWRWLVSSFRVLWKGGVGACRGGVLHAVMCFNVVRHERVPVPCRAQAISREIWYDLIEVKLAAKIISTAELGRTATRLCPSSSASQFERGVLGWGNSLLVGQFCLD